MRILLQHTGNGMYCQGPDRWTDDPERAVDFRFIDRALHYIEDWNLDEVEFAFAFGELEEVTHVPLERVALRIAAG
jgi:hypothetical protein